MTKMIPINLDLLSGKVVQNIEFEDIYSGKSMFIYFEDGTYLEVNSIYDGGVYGIAMTPNKEIPS